MKMNIFFTSDTHFHHTNIIKYSSRPFTSVEEMNETLIERWNSVVGKTDDIWHLGDFAFAKFEKMKTIFNRLNGRKKLIVGNHDHDDTFDLSWHEIQDYKQLSINNTFIILCHYKFQVWNRLHHGSVHLYGHSHNQLKPNRQSIDVGVDNPAWNYTPVTFEQISEELAKHSEIDSYTGELK